MRISIRGAIVGAIIAIAEILLLIYLPQFAGSYLKGLGADATSTFGSVFLGTTAIMLVVLMAILTIPGRAIKDAPRVTGLVKVLQGALIGAYYYVILNGGTLSVGVLYGNLQLTLTATVILVLTLLELSAAARIVQGLLEIRESNHSLRAPPQTPSYVVPAS